MAFQLIHSSSQDTQWLTGHTQDSMNFIIIYYMYYIISYNCTISASPLWSAATPQPAVTQERGCVRATTQEVTQDDVSRHSNSGVPLNSYSKTVILHYMYFLLVH